VTPRRVALGLLLQVAVLGVAVALDAPAYVVFAALFVGFVVLFAATRS
jgi:hypothetical protein